MISARGSLFALSPILNNKALGQHTRVWLYESVVVPCLLYGLESGTLEAADLALLEKFHSKALRKLTGLYYYEGVWKEQIWYSYESVLFWAATTSIEEAMRRRRLRLGGRMLRAQNGHPCKEALSELTAALANPNATVDEWTRSLAEDMEELNVSIAVMQNRYNLHKALHVPNPYT